MKKKTQEEVENIFKDGNCELLDTYKNTMSVMKFKCSCGNESEISLNSFMKGCKCINCRKDRLVNTNIERYGVEHTSQRESTKDKVLAGFRKHIEEKKHTVEDIRKIFEDEGCQLISTEYKDNKDKLQVIFKCGCPGEISYNKFDAGQRCNNTDCMNIKKEATSIEKFGKAYYTQTEQYKKETQETSFQKYGCSHYMQNPEMLEKHNKAAYATKKYVFPSGRVEDYQGYEDIALDLLLSKFDEHDIIKASSEMPEIWYCKDDGKYHRYFPDIFVPSRNILYEVKSVYIYNLHKKETDYKRKAVEYLGYTYNLLLYSDKKNLITEFKF